MACTHTHTHWLTIAEQLGCQSNNDASEQWGRLCVAFCRPNPHLHWMIFINYVLFRKWQVNDASYSTYCMHSLNVVMTDIGQRDWNNWFRISRADWRLKQLITLNCPLATDHCLDCLNYRQPWYQLKESDEVLKFLLNMAEMSSQLTFKWLPRPAV